MRGDKTRRDKRRGSALVVVIGALALIAVFGALYVTIGQGDQRIAKAVTDARDVSEVDRVFARRILSIVAEDRLAAYPEAYIDPDLPGYAAGGEPNAQRFVREGTDYPYTDYSVRSVFPLNAIGVSQAQDPWLPNWAATASAGNAAARARSVLGFDPVGNASTPWIASQSGVDIREDRRVASDPWLASTEPSFIGWRNLPVNSTDTNVNRVDNDGRAYSLLQPGTSPFSHAALRYMDARDWKQISNIAPDGRFVNLFNLRGNFDAEPGIGENGGEYRMTSRLTLLEPIAMRRNSPLRATTKLPFGLGDADVNGDNEVDDQFLNIPAIWSSNQRFMFFPLNQPEAFQVGTIEAASYDNVNGLRADDAAGWGDFEFPDYQYADADGDGMADARWFELADASDPQNVVFELPVGEYRFFGASRIIDLSALVNVNSATDGLRPPTNWAPLGMTPADVDLRRLLQMSDQARGSRQNPLRAGVADPDRIDAAWAAAASNAAGNFDPRTDGLSFRHIEHPVGYFDDDGREWGSQNYLGYLEKVDSGLPDSTPLRVAGLLGGFSYDALRRTIEADSSGLTLGDSPTNFAGRMSFGGPGPVDPSAGLIDASPFEYTYNAGGSAGTTNLYRRLSDSSIIGNVYATQLPLLERNLLGRSLYYDAVGSRNAAKSGDESSTALASALFGSRLFGLDDLSELLTFRGINDDSRYSRLEETVGGRYFIDGVNATSDATTLRFSPLRSNRATALERLTHDNVADYPQAINAQSLGQIRPDGVIDQETMALFALSPRARLTTVSGASPIRSSVIYEDISGGVGNPNYRRWAGGSGALPPLIPIGAGTTIDNAGGSGPTAVDQGAVDLRSATLKSGRIDLRLLVDDMLATNALTPLPDQDPRAIRRRAVDTLFKVYADALLPESDIENGLAWEDTGGEHLWTLFYGHKGPEPALLAAAHLTANMKDMVDGDDQPTGMTVVVEADGDGEAWAYAHASGDPPQEYAFPWGVADGGVSSVADGYILDLDRGNPNNFNAPNTPIGDSKLHRNPDDTVPEARKAVTVFGIEAHPIITEVASIIVYADAQNLGGGFNVPAEATITADPDPNAAGIDVAIQMIAFQLHNPFDVPVDLGNANDPTTTAPDVLDGWRYAIEWNGYYFPVASYVYDQASAAPLRYEFRSAGTLGPGESKVFYALNYSDFEKVRVRFDEIISEFSADGMGLTYPTDAQATIQSRFFRRQFTNQNNSSVDVAAFLQRIDPLTGVRQTDDVDLFDPAAVPVRLAAPGAELDDEVRLWLSYRAENSDEPAFTPDLTGPLPWLDNDILVDRLRDPDPTADTWDVALDNNEVISLDSDGDGVIDAPFTSFTITRWASVRRPDHFDDMGNGDLAPQGAVPAYMLESVSGAFENIVHEALPQNLDYNDFSPGDDAFAPLEFGDFLDTIGFTDDTVPQNASPLVPSMATDPDRKAKDFSNYYHLGDLTRLGLSNPYAGESESPQTAVDPSGQELYISEIQPEIYNGPSGSGRSDFKRVIGSGTNEVEISTLRVTDILRPLAIGPRHIAGNDPSFNAGGPAMTLAVGDGEWLTLGEALSIALGFEERAFYEAGRNATTGAIDPATYTPLADQVGVAVGPSATARPVRMFDRGQIRLDAFVPFVNVANFNTGAELARDVPLYQPEFGDYRIGGGATPAARLLGSLRAITPNVGEVGPATGSPFDANELATPLVGTVNINTAPLSVLRLLPGLSPSLEVDSRGVDESWMRNPQWNQPPLSGTQRTELGLPDPRDPTLLGSHSQATPNAELWLQRPDIAATIAAYRDRTIADIRFDSREPFPGDNRIDDLTFAPMSFGLFTGPAQNNPRLGLLARNFDARYLPSNTAWDAFNTADRGRYMMNGQEGVRELPGFGSLGELLGAAVADEEPLARPGLSTLGGGTGYVDFGVLNFDELSTIGGVGTAESRWAGDAGNGGRTINYLDPTDNASANDNAPNIFGFHDLFALARDGESFGRVNTGSVAITNEAYLRGANNQTDELEDDYDEQLAALAGIMNVADVRSDYFAAWYVIRGYRESDVEGLSPDEPMLPSFEKRYLLVIDRSNVIEAGDRPRVVLFRELPL